MGIAGKTIKGYFKSRVRAKHIYSAMRFVPRVILEQIKQRRLRELVAYCAAKSVFYKEKFKFHGINPDNVRSMDDLKGIFTTGMDLIERRKDFICGQDLIAFETTGTQGRNKWLHFSRHEINKMANSCMVGLLMLDFRRTDRFLNCFNYSFWVPGFVFQRGVEKLGAFCLGASKTSPESIYERLDAYKINALLGYPSLLMRVTDLAEKHGAPKITGIMTAGERITPEVRSWMEQVWGCNVYATYGLTEACGGVGGECVRKNGYHIDELLNIVEIDEPDEYGYGEIILTTLTRRCMPLIRYRTGDVGRIIRERCGCGLPTMRLENVPGRIDEKIKIGTAYFLPNVFDRAIHSVDGVKRDYQLVAYWKGNKEVLELNLESEIPSDKLSEEVLKAIFREDKDMANNVSYGMFTLKIRFNPPGSLRGDDIKLKRFVDKRLAQEGRRDYRIEGVSPEGGHNVRYEM
ncbi:MAG: AMP-binding protein [bacterium]